jgi:small-conductance mechanosensitive channel
VNSGLWLAGLTSGTRRTISRAVTCSFFALLVNAVKGTSATSASLTQRWVSSSQIALVYLIGVHASAGMASIAMRTGGSRRAVIEKWARCRSTAATMSDW